MTVRKFLKIGSDWVDVAEIAAVERRPGGGARVHLKSGAQLAYGDEMTPDAVVQQMTKAMEE